MSSKPKLCLLGNHLSAFGHTPQVCETLAEEFSKKGLEVVRGGERSSRFSRLLHMAAALFMHGRTIDYALIDTFSGSAFSWAYICYKIAHLLHIPYIPILHGGELPRFADGHPALMLDYIRHAYSVVTPSPYLRGVFKGYPNRIHVIPNPIHVGRYPFNQSPVHNHHILWIRRFHDIYNPKLALRIVQRLVLEFPDVHLTMAGPDSGALLACKALCGRLKLQKHVTFLPKVSKEKIVELSETHEIFLNTSDIDNAPVSLVEAALLGLPIVSTDSGGIAQLFRSHDEIKFAPVGNHNLLADAIGGLFKSDKEKTRISANARNAMLGQDWSRAFALWRHLFEGGKT